MLSFHGEEVKVVNYIFKPKHKRDTKEESKARISDQMLEKALPSKVESWSRHLAQPRGKQRRPHGHRTVAKLSTKHRQEQTLSGEKHLYFGSSELLTSTKKKWAHNQKSPNTYGNKLLWMGVAGSNEQHRPCLAFFQRHHLQPGSLLPHCVLSSLHMSPWLSRSVLQLNFSTVKALHNGIPVSISRLISSHLTLLHSTKSPTSYAGQYSIHEYVIYFLASTPLHTLFPLPRMPFPIFSKWQIPCPFLMATQMAPPLWRSSEFSRVSSCCLWIHFIISQMVTEGRNLVLVNSSALDSLWLLRTYLLRQ